MENIEQSQARLAARESQTSFLDGIAFKVATLTALSCIGALFLINLEYLLPEMARTQGLVLPYEHKLWLAPMSIVYLLASIAWTISHLTRKEN